MTDLEVYEAANSLTPPIVDQLLSVPRSCRASLHASFLPRTAFASLAKLLFLMDKATKEPFHPRSNACFAENFSSDGTWRFLPTSLPYDGRPLSSLVIFPSLPAGYLCV